MEVIFLLPVASLPDQEDLNLAEGNPMLVEYRLPEEEVGDSEAEVAGIEVAEDSEAEVAGTEVAEDSGAEVAGIEVAGVLGVVEEEASIIIDFMVPGLVGIIAMAQE